MQAIDYVQVRKYGTAHWYMSTHHTREGRCEWCGTRRITEWATARPLHWTYNRADWLELCIPCHKRYDGFCNPTRVCKRCGASDWIPNPSKHVPDATRCRPCTYAANRRHGRR